MTKETAAQQLVVGWLIIPSAIFRLGRNVLYKLLFLSTFIVSSFELNLLVLFSAQSWIKKNQLDKLHWAIFKIASCKDTCFITRVQSTLPFHQKTVSHFIPFCKTVLQKLNFRFSENMGLYLQCLGQAA